MLSQLSRIAYMSFHTKSKSSHAEFEIMSRKISWSYPWTKVVPPKFHIRPGRRPLSKHNPNATPNKINVNR